LVLINAKKGYKKIFSQIYINDFILKSISQKLFHQKKDIGFVPEKDLSINLKIKHEINHKKLLRIIKFLD